MERLVLAAILVAALALRAFGLGQNGWGAEYYSAAVLSMGSDWRNFFFCAFDPAGFISVDKPPVALWIQVASTKLFGYRPESLLLPQAVEGTLCVLLVHGLVRRRFGAVAGLVAAFLLAITPVLVAVNRTNNVDSALLLVLLSAAAALLHATESGRRRWLLASMALVGIAFNTKMLAGFIVLPAFAATYFLAAPGDWRRRMADLALGGVVLAIVSSAWVLAVDLTPAGERPYVGSSTTNSALELTIGHNALSRFMNRAPAPASARVSAPSTPAASPADTTEPRPGLLQRRLFVGAPAGPLRLFDGRIAAQTSWFAPFALLAIFAVSRREPWRRPVPASDASLLFWFFWLATYAVVYSFAGGIIHYYYFATLAPALAALAAIGLVYAWRAFFEESGRRWLLPGALAVTALWQACVQLNALGWPFGIAAAHPDDWRTWLHWIALGGASIAAIALVGLRARQYPRRASAGVLCAGAAALLALPLAWTAASVATAGNGILPSADLYRLDPAVLASEDARTAGRFGKPADVAGLAEFLATGNSGERFLIATTTTRFAAPIIIETGRPVMAMGGYHGLDAAMTPGKLERLVAEGRVRFVMLNDAGLPSRRLGAEAALAPIGAWVRRNGKRVPRAQWPSATIPREVAVYDMKPGRR